MNNQFYTYEDLMRMLNVGRSKAYQIIKVLNSELVANGYIVPKPGQVQKSYVHERLFIVDECKGKSTSTV